MRADRLLQIVTLLRQHGQLSAAELARRLEVTPRTVLRDMEALSVTGIPVYAERGRHGGFALVPGYRPVTEELTAVETQALLLAGSVPADRLGLAGPLASALRKLAGSAPAEHGRSAARISDRIVVDAAGWYSDPEDPTHFGTVQEAVLSDRRLRLGYRPRDRSEAGVRTVDPYGLLQAAGVWYLIAGHRRQPRSYRLSRILEAEVLDEPSRRPPDLDLRALWRQLRSEFARPPTLTIRLVCESRVAEHALRLLAGQGAGVPRVLDPGPPVVVELEVQSFRSTVGMLAGMGGGVRALDPPELRDLMVEVAAEIVAAYAPHPPLAQADRPEDLCIDTVQS